MAKIEFYKNFPRGKIGRSYKQFSLGCMAMWMGFFFFFDLVYLNLFSKLVFLIRKDIKNSAKKPVL